MAGSYILGVLGIKVTDLVQPKIPVSVADSYTIKILGAMFVVIYGVNDRSGVKMDTMQLLYVAEGTNQLYLSKVMARDLGLVSVNFPQVADCKIRRGHFDVIHDNTHVNQYSPAECEFPVRTLSPPAPCTIPYDMYPANTTKIRAWVKELYAKSALNTCNHQRLPLMSTSPPLGWHIE